MNASVNSQACLITTLLIALVMRWGPVLADEAAIDRGRYLATAGNCASCHTQKQGQAFAGGVAFATPFGTLYSTNITPDETSGIGGWTTEEFKRALRSGLRPDGDHLYPAFPYQFYTRLSDADIADLFAFLQSLQPVSAVNRENELNFPFNIRALIGVWKWLYLEEGPIVADANQTKHVQRGAYLTEALGHCGMCHSPRNAIGGLDNERAFSGGVFHQIKADGKRQRWSATNLTPAKSGLANWTEKDLASYLKTGLSAPATVFGPMNEVIMNSTSKLRDVDVAAMVAYLRSLPVQDNVQPLKLPDAQTLQAGSRVYTIHCGTCHLPTGKGGADIGVPLVGSAVALAPDPASLINVILHGMELPPSPFGSGREMKKSFGDKMRDAEVAALATYIRSSWGNRASPVTAEQVQQQR